MPYKSDRGSVRVLYSLLRRFVSLLSGFRSIPSIAGLMGCSILLMTMFLSRASGQSLPTCSELRQLIKLTYNFKPSKLSDSERNVKSQEMDRVWNAVKSNSKDLVPCLRDALTEPGSDQWFRFDGGMLLVMLDPSPASKAIEIRGHTEVDLNDVDLRIWVRTLSSLAAEGFDVSGAGERWLSYPKARYSLPEHGGYEVNTRTGALFIYGSMDETEATPALVKLAEKGNQVVRETALWLLTQQATNESLEALKGFDLSDSSGQARHSVDSVLKGSNLIPARRSPKSTREEFLQAFQHILSGDFAEFADLTSKVPDGEKDVVAVMKPEDLPLIRKVRRKIISLGNQHVVEYYDTFTQILMTLVRKQPSK